MRNFVPIKPQERENVTQSSLPRLTPIVGPVTMEPSVSFGRHSVTPKLIALMDLMKGKDVLGMPASTSGTQF